MTQPELLQVGRDGRPLRVLHITETFAAGTGTAIVGFARGTKSRRVQSFLLAQDRGSGLLDTLPDRPFEEAEILPPGLFRLWRAVDPAIREWRPDVVHAHSSLAGGVVRLRLLSRRRPPVVYSPHCFAFERRDVTAAVRWVMRMTERALAHATTAFVCVSPHEAALASQLRPGTRIVSLVNCFEPGPVTGPGRPAARPALLRLVSVGRVAPQKDPVMFGEVVQAVRASGVEVEATWIGSGDHAASRRALEAAQVQITGWLPAHEVAAALSGQSVYVHTAKWEAAVPIAVLDAMAAGIAVSVRANPAYRGMIESDWQFDDVPEAVAMILRLRQPHVQEERVRDQFGTLRELYRRGPGAVLPVAYRDLLEPTA